MSTPEATALPSLEDRARCYERRKRLAALVDYLLGIGVLAALLFTGGSHGLRDWALGLTPNPVWALALYLLVLRSLMQALSFPLHLYSSHVLEHQFELSRRTFSVWLKDWVKAFGLRFALGDRKSVV